MYFMYIDIYKCCGSFLSHYFLFRFMIEIDGYLSPAQLFIVSFEFHLSRYHHFKSLLFVISTAKLRFLLRLKSFMLFQNALPLGDLK